MISEKIVREDLENIKYYSVRRYVLDSYLKDFGENDIVNLAEKYNKVIKTAPIKFYHLYVLRYLKGYTQEESADEMGYTTYTIQNMQTSLILWLRNNIQKDD